MSSMDNFFIWERVSRDTIDFKKIYVDMTGGDILAGLTLSEIVYWYLPTKNGGSKLRVEHDGKYWIAVHRYEWWERVRMTPNQADRILTILVTCGLIEKSTYKFSNQPTTHIRLIEERFLALWHEFADKQIKNPYLPKPKDAAETDLIQAEIPNSAYAENAETALIRPTPKPNSAYAETQFGLRRNPLTETTTEITTEINTLRADAREASPEPPIEAKSEKPFVRNPGALAALQGFEARKGEVDFSPFPEDVREVIREFYRLWKVVPPARRGKQGGQFALWLKEARELREACGEFGLKVLQAYYDDWKDLPDNKKFMPGRPGSLTYHVGAKAGDMRRSQSNSKNNVLDWDKFVAMYKDMYDRDPEEEEYKAFLRNQGVRV